MTKRKHAPPAGLSHDAICTAALRLIDDEGLDEFSTRKLGRALGCEAMAIYWYYPSKDALLDAVVDKLTENLSAALTVHDHPDWIAVLRDVAHAYRRIAHDHPQAFPLLATRRFELARRQNIDDQIAAQFYRVVSSYCSGFALNELATLRGAAPHTAALRKRFGRVAEVSKWLEPRYLDEMFDFGLELQLQALARMTEAR